MLRICRGRSCATAPGQCSDFQPNRRPGRGRTAGEINGQRDGQAGGQWHIYGTQEWKKLFTSVSQRQRTTHETADRKHSERVSAVLLIRRSSIRARRGQPGVLSGTFALLTGLPATSSLAEMSRRERCVAHIESAGRQVGPDPAHQVFVQVSEHWGRLRPSRTVPEQRANGTFMAYHE